MDSNKTCDRDQTVVHGSEFQPLPCEERFLSLDVFGVVISTAAFSRGLLH